MKLCGHFLPAFDSQCDDDIVNGDEPGYKCDVTIGDGGGRI